MFRLAFSAATIIVRVADRDDLATATVDLRLLSSEDIVAQALMTPPSTAMRPCCTKPVDGNYRKAPALPVKDPHATLCRMNRPYAGFAHGAVSLETRILPAWPGRRRRPARSS